MAGFLMPRVCPYSRASSLIAASLASAPELPKAVLRHAGNLGQCRAELFLRQMRYILA